MSARKNAFAPPKVGSTTVTVTHHDGHIHITKTIVVGVQNDNLTKPTISNALPSATYTRGESFASSGSTVTAAFDALWTAKHKTSPHLAAAIQTASGPAHSARRRPPPPMGLWPLPAAQATRPPGDGAEAGRAVNATADVASRTAGDHRKRRWSPAQL